MLKNIAKAPCLAPKFNDLSDGRHCFMNFYVNSGEPTKVDSNPLFRQPWACPALLPMMNQIYRRYEKCHLNVYFKTLFYVAINARCSLLYRFHYPSQQVK